MGIAKKGRTGQEVTKMNDISKNSRNRNIGIQALSVYVPHYALSHKDLAYRTGQDPEKFTSGLGCNKMAVPHPTEDVVTMAAEAGETLMERWHVDPDEIGMLIVATESGVDWAKPVAAYIHHLLGISHNCTVFDVQHACFGASAALSVSVSWILSGINEGKKALVIASDIAKYEMGSPGEPTQGAGAVAMLVGEGESRILEPDFSLRAIYAKNVMDFWRPGFCNTAVVNGKYSVECYLKALSETYTVFRKKGGESYTEMRYLLFHLPFPKMAMKALTALVETEAKISGKNYSETHIEDVYHEKVLPGTLGAKEVGNIYCGSLYLSLASLLESEGSACEGQKVGMFSYGSGSCAEFFSGRIGKDRKIWEGKINLISGLARREMIDYETYVEFRKSASNINSNDSFQIGVVPMGDKVPPHARHLFLGYRNFKRIYISGSSSKVRIAERISSGVQSPS